MRFGLEILERVRNEIGDYTFYELLNYQSDLSDEQESVHGAIVHLLLLLFTTKELNSGLTLPDGRPIIPLISKTNQDRKVVLNHLLSIWRSAAPREVFAKVPSHEMTDPLRGCIILRNLLCGRVHDAWWHWYSDQIARPGEEWPDLTIAAMLKALRAYGEEPDIDDAVMRMLVLDLLDHPSSSVADTAATFLTRVKVDDAALERVRSILPRASKRTIGHILKWVNPVAEHNNNARHVIRDLLRDPLDDVRRRAAERLLKHLLEDDISDDLVLLALESNPKLSARIRASVPAARIAKAIDQNLAPLAAGTLDPTRSRLLANALSHDPRVERAFCELLEPLASAAQSAPVKGDVVCTDAVIRAFHALSGPAPRLPAVIWELILTIWRHGAGNHLEQSAAVLAASKPSDPIAQDLLLNILGQEGQYRIIYHGVRHDTAALAVSVAEQDNAFRTRLLAFVAADEMGRESADGLWRYIVSKLTDEDSQQVMATLLGRQRADPRERHSAIGFALESSDRVSWSKPLAKAIVELAITSKEHGENAEWVFRHRIPGTLQPFPRRIKDKLKIYESMMRERTLNAEGQPAHE